MKALLLILVFGLGSTMTLLHAGERQNGGGLIIGRFIAGKDLMLKQLGKSSSIEVRDIPKVVPEELEKYGFRRPEDYQTWFTQNRSTLTEKLKILRFEKNPKESADCAQTDAIGPVVLLNIDLCSQQVFSISGAAAITLGEAIHHTSAALNGGTRTSWSQSEEDTFAAFYSSIAEIRWYERGQAEQNTGCITEAKSAKEFTNAVQGYSARTVLELLDRGLRIHEPMLSADCSVEKSYFQFTTEFFADGIGSAGYWLGGEDDWRKILFLKQLLDGGKGEFVSEIMAAAERASDKWQTMLGESLTKKRLIDVTIKSSLGLKEEALSKIDTFLILMKATLPESFDRSRDSIFAYAAISDRQKIPDVFEHVDLINPRNALSAAEELYTNESFAALTWTQKLERLSARGMHVDEVLAQQFLDEYLDTQTKNHLPIWAKRFSRTLLAMIEKGAKLSTQQVRALLFQSVMTIKSHTWEFDHHSEMVQRLHRRAHTEWLEYHRFLQAHVDMQSAVDDHGRNLYDYLYYYEFLYSHGLKQIKERTEKQALLEKAFGDRLATTTQLFTLLRDELSLSPSGQCISVELPSRGGGNVGVTYGLRLGPTWGSNASLISTPYIIDTFTNEPDERLRRILLREIPPAVKTVVCPK